MSALTRLFWAMKLALLTAFILAPPSALAQTAGPQGGHVVSNVATIASIACASRLSAGEFTRKTNGSPGRISEIARAVAGASDCPAQACARVADCWAPPGLVHSGAATENCSLAELVAKR